MGRNRKKNKSKKKRDRTISKKIYFVRLKPLDSYFFSGRETFNYSSGRESIKNYYVKSEYFPQQTTILGMLRKEILIATGYYKEDRREYSNNLQEIIDLIGEGSFNAEGHKNEDGFGKIKNISPIFLYKDGNIFAPAPLDYGLKFEKLEGNCYFNSENKDNKADKDYKNFIPNLKNYEAKNGLNRKITSFNIFEKEYLFDDIFEEDERIGIDTKAIENGYYRQLYYKLKNNFEFCFFIKLEEDIFGIREKESYKTTVYIGAEGKPFKFEITKSSLDFEKLVENYKTSKERIVCISDIILNEDEFYKLKTEVDFILGEKQFFKNYIYRYKDNIKESKPYIILKRGSVIYVSKESQKIEEIINKKHIKVIGYNYITGGIK
jgi:CRISPR-associated protein Cmr3